MFSIFFGFSGAGGGGSSFFLGITYGPTSFCGPPASGGASCWFGFAGGGWAVFCASAAEGAALQKRTNANAITRLREADRARFRPPNTPENIGNSSKTPVLV